MSFGAENPAGHFGSVDGGGTGGTGGTVHTDGVTLQGDGSVATPVQILAVQTDATLTGAGTVGSPLHAVATAPTFAAPPDIGPNEGVAGVAASVNRSDAIPGQKIVANWKTATTEAAVRYFAVDYDAGNDANAGFSDVSMAAAGTVALKTLEQLDVIFPALGHGRNCYAAIATRAAGALYLRKDGVTNDTPAFLNGSTGYNNLGVRGTGTDATAGAVKFADDTNDKTSQGSITATGMNAAGYHPTGAATTISVPCTLAGGGAPGFPANTTTAIPWSARMRFDVATTTAALRNVCRKVHTVVGTDTLVPQQAWPAAPVAGDTFYLEMPGAAVASMTLQTLSLNGTQSRGLSGLRTTGAMNFVGSPGRLSYLWCGGGFFQAGGDLQTISELYSAPIGTGASLGLGLRVAGVGATFQPAPRRSFISSSGFAGYLENENGSSLQVGNGTAWNGQFIQTGSLSPSSGDPLSHPSFIGTDQASIGTYARSYGSGVVSVGSNEGLSLSDSLQLNAVDFINCGAKPCVRVKGTMLAIRISTPGGSAGNTDVGLDLTQAQGCTIYLAGTPTVTGTLGDVRLADGTIITWATAIAGIIDANRNLITGPLKTTTAHAFSPIPDADNSRTLGTTSLAWSAIFTYGLGLTGCPATVNFIVGQGAQLDSNGAGGSIWISHQSTGRFTSDVNGIQFFGGNVPAGTVAQQVGGAATAGVVYTVTEQGMINRMYTALRNYGLLT